MPPKRKTAEASSSRRSSRRREPSPTSEEEEIREMEQGGAQMPQNTYGIEGLSAEQIVIFQQLMGRPMLPTRYSHTRTLRKLGLLRDVARLLRSQHCHYFNAWRLRTYPKFVVEFLSTLKVENLTENDIQPCMLTFRLNNMERQMHIDPFNRVYHFRERSPRSHCPSFNLHKFWSELTGQSRYHSKTAKSTLIQNPVFRYVHRVLAHTIFARSDSHGSVRVGELHFMWAMIYNFQVDVGYILLQHLVTQAQEEHGRIYIGGMITPLLHYFKIDLTGVPYLQNGPDVINTDVLTDMKMITQEGTQCFMLLRGIKSIPLPTSQTAIQEGRNWLYAPFTQNADHLEHFDWVQLVPNPDEPNPDADAPGMAAGEPESGDEVPEAEPPRGQQFMPLVEENHGFTASQYNYLNSQFQAIIQHQTSRDEAIARILANQEEQARRAEEMEKMTKAIYDFHFGGSSSQQPPPL